MVPRHLPPVGGGYGVINERRLNGGTSEGDPRKEGGALTLKVRRKKEEKGPILHTLHYIWDRVGDESSVLSGTMSLAKMPIISLFSQPLSSFKILQAYSLQQQFQSAKRPIVLRPLLAVFVRNFSEI